MLQIASEKACRLPQLAALLGQSSPPQQAIGISGDLPSVHEMDGHPHDQRGDEQDEDQPQIRPFQETYFRGWFRFAQSRLTATGHGALPAGSRLNDNRRTRFVFVDLTRSHPKGGIRAVNALALVPVRNRDACNPRLRKVPHPVLPMRGE